MHNEYFRLFGSELIRHIQTFSGSLRLLIQTNYIDSQSSRESQVLNLSAINSINFDRFII